jgi:DNA-binding CsgD family transcriptional regulator
MLLEETTGRAVRDPDDYGELTDTLARVRGASGPSTIWAGVKEFAERFGYSHVLALDLTRLAGGATGAVLYSDALPLLGEVDREMVVDQHPVVRRVLNSADTFLVSDVRDEPQHRGARWVELLAEPVREGDGLVVPVHREGQAVAGANFGGHRPNTSVLTRAFLQVLTHAAVDRAMTLRDGPVATVGVLSARESQCLRHVAIGRPDAEIGQLLGISPRTVRFHVDSAKTKLGVSTRIQAVAKALRERIIVV